MGLNWNEIKSRALLFSKTWADACNEDSQAKPFWIDFFEIFGITNKRVATFELNVKKLGGAQGFVDLFWPGFAGEPLSNKHRNTIEEAAQCVLDARAQFADSTLADLYDPLTMPPALLKAHKKTSHCRRRRLPTQRRQKILRLLRRTRGLPVRAVPTHHQLAACASR